MNENYFIKVNKYRIFIVRKIKKKFNKKRFFFFFKDYIIKKIFTGNMKCFYEVVFKSYLKFLFVFLLISFYVIHLSLIDHNRQLSERLQFILFSICLIFLVH